MLFGRSLLLQLRKSDSFSSITIKNESTNSAIQLLLIFQRGIGRFPFVFCFVLQDLFWVVANLEQELPIPFQNLIKDV